MATHKSAEKRNKQNLKRNERNKAAKSKMKSVIKDLRDAATATGSKKETLLAKLQTAQKVIASTASKGVINTKTGARYVSRLASLVNKAK